MPEEPGHNNLGGGLHSAWDAARTGRSLFRPHPLHGVPQLLILDPHSSLQPPSDSRGGSTQGAIVPPSVGKRDASMRSLCGVSMDSVKGGAHCLSFRITILYGRPHGLSFTESRSMGL